jgi:hypothetical protein
MRKAMVFGGHAAIAVGARLVLPPARLVIRAVAEISDKRLGFRFNAFHSRGPARRPGHHFPTLYTQD